MNNRTSNPETNRDKVLRGEAVEVSDGRLREMQEQAIRFEGVPAHLPTYHWHWAAAINELIERRVEVQKYKAWAASCDPTPPETTTPRSSGHPWAAFLDARARAIDWLYYRNPDMATHHNDEAIAKSLSMDRVQVYLIRTRDERPGDDKEAREVGALIREQTSPVKSGEKPE